MYVRTKSTGPYTYVQVVESVREGKRVRQRVLGTLGRLDRMRESGELEALAASVARLSERVLVLGEHRRGEAPTIATRRIGPALVFERLWRELGCAAVIDALLAGRRFEFPVERAIFLEVLHRLFSPGSDRDGYGWRRAYAVAGTEGLDLHHAYRAMAWLGESLEGDGSTDSRCVKDLIEERLFERRRDLFSEVEVAFFDTTSLYFESEGGEDLGARGHSKDARPDLKQMVVGVVLDEQGRPLCCELWPGNTADVTTLLPIAERLSRRFGVTRACLVADRGMISADTVASLEARDWPYILGTRMRNAKVVRDEVLSRAGRYRAVAGPRAAPHEPSPLEVKDVTVEGKRYIVCRNRDQARKDAADREAIVAALTERLAHQGAKSLIGNRGYRRYLAPAPAMAVDAAKVEAEARYDGKWVLATNTTWDSAEIALRYKQLWMVEDAFRSMKSLLSTRPIFHRTDPAIRGHVFCSFLALLLRKELQDRLADRDCDAEWADVVRDLDRLEEVEVASGGNHWLLRTTTDGVAGKVCQAAGVALPPAIRQARPPTPAEPAAESTKV